MFGTVRAAVIGLALTFGAVAGAQAAPRAFTREDYQTYFSPGRFETHATYYASFGVFEVLSNKTYVSTGKFILEQSARALDVSPNYDVLSDRVFYKIQSHNVQQMIWDEARKLYVYVYSDRDFDSNDSVVWESRDQKIEISKDDVNRGLLHQFYRDADKRAKQDVKQLDARYRYDVTGTWTQQCAYIQDVRYEVECTVVHQPTQRVEHYFYRKLDLVS